jgi:hypothetical protein
MRIADWTTRLSRDQPGGASFGTLTSTTTKGGGGAGQALADRTYWFAFSDGSYRKVTLAGSSCSWSGALAKSATTTAYVYGPRER